MPEIETAQPVDDVLSQIDDGELLDRCMELLQNDRKDKEDFGWAARRQYDEEAYNGYRPEKVTRPWKNAANYHVHLTRTLMDTAHANVMGSVFADPENTVDVRGIGPEDVRKEAPLESLLNDQVANDINAHPVMDSAVHLAFLHGTSVIKVIQSVETGSVKWIVVPAENIFVPVDVRGFQVDQTDHVFEVVPLTENKYEEMIQTKNERGEPFFKGLEDVPKGWGVQNSTAMQVLTNIRDAIFGTEKTTQATRDYRYIVEGYLTYWHRSKGADVKVPKRKIELVVWFAPKSRQLLAKRINKGRKSKKGKEIVKRPYATCVPDPFWDRFWGRSWAERLRQTQEELNYSHNQNINAGDVAIRPYILYPESHNINPEDYKVAPGAWIPVPDPKAVEVIRIQADPFFERQEDRYWDLAERDTGMTELFQGRSPDPRQTLGANVLRSNKTEIRFRSVYIRIEMFWKECISLTYHYNCVYLPKDKIVKVLGTSDYKKVEELFPQGLEGEYDFGFSSAPLSEKEQEKQNKKEWCIGMFANPLVLNDMRSLWNVTEAWTEACGQRNLESMVTKPPEASAYSPEQAIQRIVSGQEVVPSPLIDGEGYVLAIQTFMRSEAFTEAEEDVQMRLIQLLQRAAAIRQGQLQSKLDAMILMSRMQAGQEGLNQSGENGKETIKNVSG